ncbi:MAG: hypothetical protein QOF78_4077, partial [Phycisphaerales bacterium]|nr:hypothetical protein [Phycisphaerales bacterium]
ESSGADLFGSLNKHMAAFENAFAGASAEGFVIPDFRDAFKQRKPLKGKAEGELFGPKMDEQPRDVRLAEFIRSDSADAFRAQFANSNIRDEVGEKQLNVQTQMAQSLKELESRRVSVVSIGMFK